MARTRGKKKQVKTRSKVGRKKVRGGKTTPNDSMYYTSAALLGGNALVDLLKTGFDKLKDFLPTVKDTLIEKNDDLQRWLRRLDYSGTPGRMYVNNFYGGMLPGWKGYHPRGYRQSEAQADLEKIKQYYAALESM